MITKSSTTKEASFKFPLKSSNSTGVKNIIRIGLHRSRDISTGQKNGYDRFSTYMRLCRGVSSLYLCVFTEMVNSFRDTRAIL